jgi:hypothetical protein
LFFADQKLSRRHARFDPGPEGVELVDLGSRNGTWVNERAVQHHRLVPGDILRLGGLRILLEEDEPPPPPGPVEEEGSEQPMAEEARTVMLGPTKSAGTSEDSTVNLAKTEARPSSAPAEATVLLRAQERSPRETPPPSVPAGGGPQAADHTVMLESEDRAAVVTPPGQMEAPLAQEQEPFTRVWTPDRAMAMLRGEEESPPPAGPVIDPDQPTRDRLRPQLERHPPPLSFEAPTSNGTLRRSLALTLSGLALFCCLASAAPLLRTIGSLKGSLEAEWLRRGMLLLESLEAVNAPLLAAGRLDQLSTGRSEEDPSVTEVLLLDLEGRVLAPSTRRGETLPRIEGVDREPSEVFAFTHWREGFGEYLFARPMFHDGRRLGVSVVRYAPGRAGTSAGVLVGLFISLLLAGGAAYGALVLVGRRTWVPLGELREAVLKLSQGERTPLPAFADQPDWRDLTDELQALIERAPDGARIAFSQPSRTDEVSDPSGPVEG